MKLQLPLHHYDEQGRILPARMYWLLLLFLSRGWWVLVISLANRQDTSAILTLLYPNQKEFYLTLLVGSPVLLVALLSAWRERLFATRWRWAFAFFKPMFIALLALDIGLMLDHARASHWVFNPWLAAGILFDLLFLVWTIRSVRLRLMLADWRHHTETEDD